MGCVKSKPAREEAELVQHQTLAYDEEQQARPHQLCLEPKTPMAPKLEDQVNFMGSHPEIDLSLVGEAKAKSALYWQGSCWSSEEISAESSCRGVSFKVEPGFVSAGLKRGTGNSSDSYAALDFAFYCMEHGKLQVYERGVPQYTHKEKYTNDTSLEMHVRANPRLVEYLIDGQTVYTSRSEPPQSLHFQICFGDEKAEVTDICYVKKYMNVVGAGGG